MLYIFVVPMVPLLRWLIFLLYVKLQWDKEYEAAESAFYDEVGGLKKVMSRNTLNLTSILLQVHRDKTTEDFELLKVKKEDVEAFKDAENQEVPAAERLEEISKSEISFWIDEIEVRTAALEEIRLEYQVRLAL